MLLLSIKPHFADAIYRGLKQYEFRRVSPRQQIPGLALIYETVPIGRITGVVHISQVIPLAGRSAAALAGASDPYAEQYDRYLRSSRSPCALMLHYAERLRRSAIMSELTSLKRPPQSFCYTSVSWEQLNDQLPPKSYHSIALDSAT